MNGEPVKPRRVLGIAHIVVGLASFAPAVKYALIVVAPLVLGPIWFCVLGVWLWRPTRRLGAALVATHSVMAIFGVLNVAFGIGALHATKSSAATNSTAPTGGGLFGDSGWLPLSCGVALLILAAASFWSAFAMRHKPVPGEPKPATVVPPAA
jgi:hypothetical protein